MTAPRRSSSSTLIPAPPSVMPAKPVLDVCYRGAGIRKDRQSCPEQRGLGGVSRGRLGRFRSRCSSLKNQHGFPLKTAGMTEGRIAGMTGRVDCGNDGGGRVPTSQSRAMLRCHSREGGNLGERAGNVAGPIGEAAVGERGQDTGFPLTPAELTERPERWRQASRSLLPLPLGAGRGEGREGEGWIPA